MTSETAHDKNALVHELGALIVGDARVTARSWDAYALVARFDGTSIQLNGFAYVAARSQPATPGGTEIHHKLKQLREAMRQTDREPWRACIVRIDRETQKILIEFEYKHPERWEVTPQTAADVAERARP